MKKEASIIMEAQGNTVLCYTFLLHVFIFYLDFAKDERNFHLYGADSGVNVTYPSPLENRKKSVSHLNYYFWHEKCYH